MARTVADLEVMVVVGRKTTFTNLKAPLLFWTADVTSPLTILQPFITILCKLEWPATISIVSFSKNIFQQRQLKNST
jgi:hypothetical protein